MPRLRRSDPTRPGLTRRRAGRGFCLLDSSGGKVEDPHIVARVHALRIPPAWKDVWISPDDRGHLQATGLDAAGRRQYLYHEDWSTKQSQAKFDDMVEFAGALPALRRRIAADLEQTGYGQARVLACMVRLLDIGFFRIGCEAYAVTNGTYGLATMRREHVTVRGESLWFDYPAKHAIRRVQHVVDPSASAVVTGLRRRRGGGDELFAFKQDRHWREIRSGAVNEYLKELSGLDISAKDFRTWNATVLAAVALAAATEPPPSATARKRREARAMREVAHYLGNTPAVCRSSYVDPRILDRHASGLTIARTVQKLALDGTEEGPATHGKIEAAVLDLLDPRAGRAFRRALRG